MKRGRRGASLPRWATAAGLAAAVIASLPRDACAQRPVPRPPVRAPATGTPRPATPPTATAPKPAASDATRTAGRYRVSIAGFTVHHETYDDPMQLDGKRDEVYLSAEVTELAKGGTPVGTTQPVRSPVFGDVGGMLGGTAGHNGRLRAGSASAEGGLRTGDSFPSSSPWRLSGAPVGERLPLALWEGELVKGENAVLVSPTIWEFDEHDLRAAYRSWADWQGNAVSRLAASPEAMALLMSLGPEAAVLPQLSEVGTAIAVSFMDDFLGKPGDRPIGLEDAGPDSSGRLQFTFKPKTLVLSFESAELALGRNIGGKGPGVISVPYTERHPKLNGDYTIYLVIERLR